jgi:hypothetical protein
MSKFDVGQRVRMIAGYDCAKKGMIGTIKKVTVDSYAVEFDSKFSGGHTCGCVCKAGHGHWVVESKLELIIAEGATAKHKAGEVVRVKSTLAYGNYGGIYPSAQQTAKRGKEVKIKSVTKNGRYKVEGSIFTWTDEMFEEFEGEGKFILSVVFDGGHKEYNYTTTDKTIKKGDKVVVPAGRENRPTTVTVTNVKLCDRFTTGDGLKHIIRKGAVEEAKVEAKEEVTSDGIMITEKFGDTTVMVAVSGKLNKQHIEKVLSRIVD